MKKKKGTGKARRTRLGRVLQLALLLLAGLLCACRAAPEKARFVEVAGWPESLRCIALAGVSYERRYRPPVGIDLTRELLVQVRQALVRKGYEVLMPGEDHAAAVLTQTLTALPGERLLARAAAPAEAVLAIHVDYLFVSATYGESNPPPVFEIEAEARLVEGHTGKELWRARADGLAGGMVGGPFPDPVMDRLQGLSMLAERLSATLPAAGTRPAAR